FANHSQRRSSSSSRNTRIGWRPASGFAIPSFCFSRSSTPMISYDDLSLVSQDQSVTADCPTALLGHEERVEIALGIAFLLHPDLAAIARAQNDTAASHDPTFVLVDELDAQQRSALWRRNLGPDRATIVGSQDRAAFADCPPLLLVTKIYVIKRYGDFGLLSVPCLAGVISVQDRAIGADNPSALVIDKIYVNQFLLRRRAQDLPGSSAVPGDSQNAIHDDVAAAG